MKGILWIIPIWGDEYVDRWLRYGFPSMMTPGNLPALMRQFPVDVLLLTGDADAARLRAACPFKISAVDVHRDGNSYSTMTRVHNTALNLAWKNDLGIVFGLADSLYADGTFAEVGRLVTEGRKAVLTQGLNVIEERLPPHMPAALLPRDLMRLAIPNLHRRSRYQIWTDGEFSAGDIPNPSVIMSALGKHGFIMRCFHVYPLFLKPERHVQVEFTIDGWELLGKALDELESNCGWLDDSDKGCLIDIAPERDEKATGGVPRRLGAAYVREQWMPRFTAPFNHWAVRHKVWLHDGVNLDDWRHVETESDAIVNELLAGH